MRGPDRRSYSPRAPVLARGEGHTFRASRTNCGPCHDEAPKPKPELHSRARAVLDELVPLALERTRSVPIHADSLEVKLTGEKARALRNILLVLEDGAADVHNPAYAEVLVASAEKASSAGKLPKQPPWEQPP